MGGVINVIFNKLSRDWHLAFEDHTKEDQKKDVDLDESRYPPSKDSRGYLKIVMTSNLPSYQCAMHLGGLIPGTNASCRA